MPAVPPLTVPSGQQGSIGISKETTFASPALPPTVFHAFEEWAPASKNIGVVRTGARKRRGQTLMATGGYEVSGLLTVESDPDTLPQLITYSLGGTPSTPTTTVINT